MRFVCLVSLLVLFALLEVVSCFALQSGRLRLNVTKSLLGKFNEVISSSLT
jgi:hypothetical protein